MKYIWEKHYEGEYITELYDIKGAKRVSIGIENGEGQSPELLRLIVGDAMVRMAVGENIMLHCAGGAGRTGTVLAAIYMIAKNENHILAIEHIRNHYMKGAIEIGKQEDSLKAFMEFITINAKVVNTANSSYDDVQDIKNEDTAFANNCFASYKRPIYKILTEESITDTSLKSRSVNNCYNNGCTVCYVLGIKYSNPLLNHTQLAIGALKLSKLDALLSLGEDRSVADAVIDLANEKGSEYTLNIFLGKY